MIGLTQEYEVDPNQPLFILDGFETTLKTISDLSMDRVQKYYGAERCGSHGNLWLESGEWCCGGGDEGSCPGTLRLTYNGNLNLLLLIYRIII